MTVPQRRGGDKGIVGADGFVLRDLRHQFGVDPGDFEIDRQCRDCCKNTLDEGGAPGTHGRVAGAMDASSSEAVTALM